MGLSTFPAPSAGPTVPLIRGWAATGSGTYTLTETLPAGIYHIETTSTDQTSNVIGFTDSEGFTWNSTINGGVGFVSLPRSSNTIIMPSSNTGFTYPMSVSIYASTQTQPTALTNTTITWAADKSYVTGTWDTPTTGVTGVRFYWQKSGVTYSANFSSATSGATANISNEQRPPANGSGIAYTLVPYTANGIYGLPASGTTGAVPTAAVTETITSSQSWVAPVSGTLTEVVIIAGGGNGGSAGYPYTGGGGGAGGMRSISGISVTLGNSYSITVGAEQSNSSAFGYSATAGGKGANYQSNDAGTGGSGGGGGGSGYGGSASQNGAAGNAGGYSPVEGYAGNTGSSTSGGGGGGAGGDGGSYSVNNNGDNGGIGRASSITGTSVTYARGGGGGYGSGGGQRSSAYGSGGGGAMYTGGYNSAGIQGVVFIKYSF